MTMLAQITSIAPDYLWSALVLFTWVVMVGGGISNWINSRKSQKREVSFSENYVTSDVCKEQHLRITKEIETMAANRRCDIRDLHEKVNHISNLVSAQGSKLNDFAAITENIQTISNCVSAQGAKLDLIGQRITELDRKFDRRHE
jgi:hypothetical protein